MKVIATYFLAVLVGNPNPSTNDLKHILGSVIGDVDEERIEFFLSQVKGRAITELIVFGREKFASVPSCGGHVSVVAPAGEIGAASNTTPAAADTKTEEKVEEKEESDEDMGFSLFD